MGKEIDRKIITMKDAKKVGDYIAQVHFHKEVTVEVPVKVVAENADELKAIEEAENALRQTPVEEAPAEEIEETPAEEAEAPVAEEEAPAAE